MSPELAGACLPAPRIQPGHAHDARLPHPYLRRAARRRCRQPARLSGWVHAKRDHGGLLFIDLRDHYGITQCVFPAGSPAFAAADAVRPESVITVTGQVVPREAGTVNPRLPTGEIELRVGRPRRAVGGRGAADAGGGRRDASPRTSA